MIKLEIIDVIYKTYYLFDPISHKEYKFELYFYGLEKLPSKGDFFGFHKELLDKDYKEYSNYYKFGPLNEIYGRKIENENHVDVIFLLADNKKIVLKRFFG